MKLNPPNQAQPLKYKREWRPSIDAQLVGCAEKIIAGSQAMQATAVEHTVTKSRDWYKGWIGKTMGNLLVRYEIFKNSVKAEVFLGMDGRKDEELWLC
jgi:hypothetical protein